MSNKSIGRLINNLPVQQYIPVMGGTVTNHLQNTGINFTNFAVYKYFHILRDYFLNRVIWSSPEIDEEELRLIEWNIFHYGKCALLKPKIKKDSIIFQFKEPKFYQCNYTETNQRTGQPHKINITNLNTYNKLPICNEYYYNEFVIFTDQFLYAGNPLPFSHIAWEYACKLHELDLAFNANSHKNRLPLLLNTSSPKENSGKYFNIHHPKNLVSEVVRSALGTNEQFVEIPEDLVSRDGFLHEPKNVNNYTAEHLETQKKIYEMYFEQLGLYTNKEKMGTYTVKDLQKTGDETGDFRTSVFKSTRLLSAKKACKMFNINLSMELI